MRYADISGWGKCLPPAILSNNDLSSLLDTNDEWITSRTGMKERRISHVPVSSLATVAAARALACAGKQALDVELIIFGSTTFDEMCPNASSNVQKQLGATNAACMDVNTACTSGMYALSVATAMIKSGVVNNAIVIGAEVISTVMDWSNRNVAVLFGDGAGAFYLQAEEQESGVIAESLGCYGESREILAVNGWGLKNASNGQLHSDIHWAFEGQEIFKKAVSGMDQACQKVLAKSGVDAADISLVVPHQANLRIIDTLTKRLKLDRDKVFINIQRYGNMSAATAPVALVEAIEEGRVSPGKLVLMPAFGGGLTWSAHLIRWGERAHSLGESTVELPPCNKTALELITPD
ncbi:ketoacyl-ACP synthase III [Dasania marina]|uniref:ketoacyl-ACP synthase III n=1 Tax=Dasania marina TaxID=471499 RepID=UPI0030D6D41B|tara:strand:+ start:25053 stop:26105 length:1053 start_codon:yes stop_codon:yes gene_type:complete